MSLEALEAAAEAAGKKDTSSPTIKNNSSREKKKSANRARHRLLSIRYDVDHYLKQLLSQDDKSDDTTETDKDEKPSRYDFTNLPIIANERCGTWYALPFRPKSFCHFKSTDGHVHLFSLKRLNLPFLKTVANNNNTSSSQKNGGGVVILDASNKKEMPDSFSRTLPIWACVLNRIGERYRRDLGIESLLKEDDKHLLFLPNWIIQEEERAKMEAIIDARVEELYQSQAIVDIPGFLANLTKPLRPFWITPLHSELPENDETRIKFHCIICCNASNFRLGGETHTSRIVWIEKDQFWYTPGAADDHESWARHLTPQLFWEHVEQFTAELTNEQTEDIIDGIVKKAADNNSDDEASSPHTTTTCGSESYDWIGNLNIAIGTRRAGRPPDCWTNFDAILNVTNTEYDEMAPSLQTKDDKFYLQLPVQEGKRDKLELERWLPVGILFCAHHAVHNRRILIHCAQGKDRSVAVAMAVVQLFCTLRYPLQWNREILNNTVQNVHSAKQNSQEGASQPKVARLERPLSGFPRDILKAMLGEDGRDLLIETSRKVICLQDGKPTATKETLRVVLHLIRQDREKAEPTRSTMQKLNRFFMSQAFKPPPAKKDIA